MKIEENYQVRNEEVEVLLKGIGTVIGEACKHHGGMGFALIMFDFGDGGSMFYISNAERNSLIEMLQEFIQKHRMH